MIILEGPDNSGKTTLGTQLNKKLGWDYEHSGRLKRPMSSIAHSTIQLRNRPVIQDRVYAISEYVYSRALGRPSDLDLKDVMTDFMSRDYLVIYCRPPTHVIKDNQGRDQMEGVIQYHQQIIDEYDFLMPELNRFAQCKVFTYDYTTMSIDMVLERARAYQERFDEKRLSAEFCINHR